MTDLTVLLEKAVTENEAASPRELTTLVLGMMEESDYFDALDKALPVYIRSWLASRRVWRENTPEEPERFAPDDLLAPDVQEIVRTQEKRTLKARGSARVAAIRTEWQRHFSDSLWNGEKYIKFGDATAADLLGASTSLRTTAKAEYEGKVSKAEYYEKIAQAVGNGKVSDLEYDPTRS